MAFSDVYPGRRVLITGHTGFKGSWLALWLQSLGAEVAGYSIGLPSEPSNFRELNLGNCIRHYVGDIRDRRRLAAVIDEFRPEMVFHLAAQALVRRSYIDPSTTFEVNTMGMVNLLDVIRERTWIQTAILITSDKAYRNDEWCWGYRETDALGGRDPYSASKSCADIIAQSYFHAFLHDSATSIATTRAGNVIGGGDWADDRVVPDCIRAWCKGEPVILRSPQATRPWQHVLEPLSGYLWLGARLWQKAESLRGEAFNFGPDAQVNQSVAELISAMASRWPGVQWRISENSDPQGHEATLLKLSCDKALFYLNWRAVLQFHETVAFTVDWYRHWQERRTEIYNYTVGQIESYTHLAQSRGLQWAT